MSMQTLTIIQFIGILAIYLGMTVLLPALIFHRRLQDERLCVRFLICLAIGNFYLMNLIFVLQLLHISNRFTLTLGTVAAIILAVAEEHHVKLSDGFQSFSKGITQFLGGTMGVKLLLSKLLRGLGKAAGKALLRLWVSIRKNFFDWVGTVGTICLVLWLFGTNIIENMGYCASDIPVHNYWINALGDNNIFVAGVYPYGFHCVIYYIHTVFGIHTFVLLRVFCLVQTLVVHLVLLAFLKACCRTKYAPYLAMVIYGLANIWNRDTYTRFYSSLPQEFGMIFILPSIYFLIAFFEDRKRENGKKGFRVHSTRYLVFFAMCFSMTLAVHFYNTMIAGLLCVGIAAGYLGLLFRKPYFGRIMLAGILSIFVAVLPMGIAFATGTPLEGSLNWGMSIISGSTKDDENPYADQIKEPDTEILEDAETEETSSPSSEAGASIQSQSGTSSEAVTQQSGVSPEPVAQQSGLRDWVNEKWEKTVDLGYGFRNTVRTYILNRVSMDTVMILLALVGFTAIPGLFYLIFRKTRGYGSIVISVSVGTVFLFVMLMARWFGLPELMDKTRCSIYLAYMISACLALCADSVICLVAGWFKVSFPADVLSLAGVLVLTAALVQGGYCKEPLNIKALESNDAIACLTNILRDNDRWMFTVCSANDELRMVEDYGFHYEVITLLRSMEGEKVEQYLTIPTPKVYFFIEKIPIDYTVSYEGSGRTVSREGAAQMLPGGAGLAMYMGANRYVVMSKMYYWAEAFQKLYPNEMKVYYETDAFICYEVDQNTYRLFDFSIDYGYNGR